MNLKALADNPPRTPVELFIRLWDLLIGLGTYRRTTARRSFALVEEFQLLLQVDSGEAASDGVMRKLVSFSDALIQEKNGALLDAMTAMDDFFLKIHPRFDISVGNLATILPTWLDNCRDTRLLCGSYYDDGERRLICRGPLTRSPRPMFSFSAESVAEYFAAVTLVPVGFFNQSRKIQVQLRIVSNGGVAGVDRKRPGAERVGFVPVASGAGEIILSYRREGNQGFVEVAVSDSVDVVKEFTQAFENATR